MKKLYVTNDVNLCVNWLSVKPVCCPELAFCTSCSGELNLKHTVGYTPFFCGSVVAMYFSH